MPNKLLLLSALLFAAIVPAHAQINGGGGNFLCYTSSTPVLVRSEGVAELTGDILITCSGGTSGYSPTANVTIFLNTVVTSTVLQVLGNGTKESEALLVIDDLASQPVVGANLIQGIANSDGRSVTFPAVPFSQGATHTIRIKNLRVNASAIPSGGPIQALISISGSTFIPLNNSQLVVALTGPGMSFSASAYGGAPVQSLSFVQAGGSNTGLANNPSATTGIPNYALTFSETFASSFKKRNAGTSVNGPNTVIDQNNPATAYNTESGLYNSNFTTTNNLNRAGLASQGTRLRAVFNNIPNNVALYVTVSPLPGSAGPSARLVSTDSAGAGAAALVSPTTTINVSNTSVGIAPVALSGNSGSAVWEILDADPGTLKQYSFGVVAVYVTPQSGNANVTGGLVPTTVVMLADATAPVPRFVDFGGSIPGCSTSPCLQYSPTAVLLSYTRGFAPPAPVTVNLASSGGPISYSSAVYLDGQISGLTWFTTSLPANGGATPSSFTISADGSGLPTGQYSATVQLNLSTGGTVTIPVILTVNQAGYLPLSCLAQNSGVTPTTRSEALADKLGDVVVTCIGGTAGAVLNTSVVVGATVNLTPRILNAANSATEALLLIDEPNSGLPGATNIFTVGSNVFQGFVQDSTHIVFPNVPIIAPGQNTSLLKYLRITNLRAQTNAAPLGANTPGSVMTTVSIPGVPVTSPTLTMAYVIPGLQVTTTDASTNNAVAGLTFQQSGGSNNALATSPNAGGGTPNYLLQFKDFFGVAFLKRDLGTSATTPNGITDQNQPGSGNQYITESGFLNTSLPATNGFNQAGLATQGTRLMARFSNVPAGAALYVTVNAISTAAPCGVTPYAQLVSTDASGAGPYSAISPTSTTTINSQSFGIAPVTLTGGSGMAVWEVLDACPNSFGQFNFGVLTAYTAPQAGTATLQATYAPLSTVTTADASAPAPRFVDLAPAHFTIAGGNNQSAQTGSAFSLLGVTATDASNNPVSGVPVTFTAPANGASGLFYDGSSVNTQFTDSSGMALEPLTANGSAGTYQVIAASGSKTLAFTLTNTPGAPTPALAITKSHPGIFYQGKTNATYTVVVSNGPSGVATSGTVTVTDTVPAGLTLTSMGGQNWTCPTGGNTCTRSDSLAPGASYDPITATVNVSLTAPVAVTNQASVSGGGISAAVLASDQTTIYPVPAISAVSVTPSAGVGVQQTFSLHYSDSWGFADILSADVAFGASTGNANTCYVHYDASADTVYLRTNDGNGVVSGRPVTGSAIGNSQCSVNLPSVTVSASGNDLYLTLPITFTSQYAGAKNIYMLAASSTANSGFQTRGTWTVGVVPTSYVVSTLAGGLLAPTSILGTLAVLGRPNVLTSDSAGNTYVAVEADNLVYKLDPGGNLTRFAGTPSTGLTGDNVPALSAQFTNILGLAADTAGNVYISEGHRVRKVSPSGVVTTIAGTGMPGFSGDNGQATSAKLDYPTSLAVDASGTLYIIDSFNLRVRKVTSDGVITTIAGNGTAGFSGDGGPATSAQLNWPTGLALDPSRNVYIADSSNHRVRKVSTSGTITTVAGNGIAASSGDNSAATSAGLALPNAVALDSAYNVYIADGSAIRRVDTGGTIRTIAGKQQSGYSGDGSASTVLFDVITSLTSDSAGNLIALDYGNRRLRQISVLTYVSTIAGGMTGDSGPALFAGISPGAVVVDGSGNRYVSESEHHRVRKIAPDGTITTYAGTGANGFSGDGGPAASAQLAGPAALAIDAQGNLYIADEWNFRVRMVNPSGTISTVAGTGDSNFSGDGGPATAAGLDPRSLAVDLSGNLYIGTGDPRVRKVSPTGTITTVAGNGTIGSSGDGGPATNAKLASATSLAVDPTGNLYIGDVPNGRIRQVTPGGTISTFAAITALAMTTSPSGTVYAVDGAGRVQLVGPTGNATPIAGSGTQLYAGDGSPALNTGFRILSGIAVDASSNVYLSDFEVMRQLTPVGTLPVLTIASSHSGHFNAGQAGTYTITVSNAASAGATSGPVTVNEVSLQGMVTSMSGSGWTCGATSCTRSEALSAGSSYAPITVTVNPPLGSPSQITHQVSVTGGGSAPAAIDDLTFVDQPAPNLSISVSHTGNFSVGQPGQYTITVSNSVAAGYTTGAVRVTDTVPAGLLLFTISANGWNCPYGNVCTTNTVLAPGQSYPPIHVNVIVTANGPGQVTNQVSVSGGGNATTVTATDPTIISYGANITSMSVSPMTGSGIRQTFTFQYSDAAGAADMATARAVVGTTDNLHSCSLFYTAASHQLSLYNDGGTASSSGVIPGSGALQNSQCSVDLSNASATASGNDLYLTVPVTFTTALAGNKNIQLSAVTSTGTSVWQIAGSWTIGAAASYLISTEAGGALPATTLPGTQAVLTTMAATATDAAGNVYLASGYAVFKFDVNGQLTRVAGNGTSVFSGDHGPAVNAGMQPVALAVDPAGNLYIADALSPVIRKVTTDGTITTVVGISAHLNTPKGIAADGAGNLYISDALANQIRKVDANGIITTIAGTGGSGFSGDNGPALSAQLNFPMGITLDQSGNLYVADNGNGRIRRITPGTTITTVAGSGAFGHFGDNGPATSAGFQNPMGVSVDANGNLFIADLSAVRKVNSAGTITTVAGSLTVGFSGDGGLAVNAQLLYANGVAVDSSGNLFVSDAGTGRLRKIDSLGIINTVAGSVPGNTIAPFSAFALPDSIVVDGSGNRYVSDVSQHVIRRIAADGSVNTIAGTGMQGYSGDNGPATSAQLSAPRGLALDSVGNLYIADSGNSRVRKISTGGIITTFAGNGSVGASGDFGLATNAQVYPTDLAFDPADNLYIGTGSLCTVRKVTPGGTITTVAGNGTCGFSGDNGPATSATLGNMILSVAVDSSGNLYIGDGSYRVRKVNSTGTITTFAGDGQFGSGGDGGPAISASLRAPFGLAADAFGNLYITDGAAIRTVRLDGTISTIAGNGSYVYAGDGGPALNAGVSQPSGVAVDNAGNIHIAESGSQVIRLLTPIGTPQLTIASAHSGNFIGGQANTYTLNVTNTAFGRPTGGTVTVTEFGLGSMLVSMTGSGWNCSGTACSRSDSLAPGNSYPPITVTVNFPAGPPPQITNQVAVSGGGSPMTWGTDLTLAAPPSLSITSSHTDPFSQGQAGAYTLTVSNSAASAPSNGLVTVTETLPAGLILTSMSGTGWNCPTGGNRCSRSDALNGGLSYPAIAVSVNVASSAGTPVTNAVAVAGGGSAPATFNDSTVVTQRPILTLTMTPDAPLVRPGSSVGYTIAVTNSAPSAPPAASVTLSDPLPSGPGFNWSISPAYSGPGTCSVASGTLTCTLGDLASGASASVHVTSGTSQYGNVVAVNSATASATNADTVSAGSTLTIEYTIWSNLPTPTTVYQLITPTTTGVKFRSDVGGTVTGIRFYKGAGNTGAYIGLLYNSTGTLLAQAAYDGSTTASGWQQILFAAPVGIAPNTTYIAAYFSNSGYAWTGNYFTSAGVDNAPLHALKSGIDGLNGVYAYGSSPTFPTAGYADSNWWADVVFAPTPTTPDLTVRSNHTGNFTQGQTAATYTITVTNGGNGSTSGTVTVNETVPTGLTATSIGGSNWNCTQPAGPCTRTDALAAASSYPALTLTVSVAANAPAGVTNTVAVSGGGETNTTNDQATDITTINTSGGGGGTATSIWDNSAVPSVIYQMSTGTTTGVKFRSDVSGTISGIRFYKGAQNTGTYIGLLYSSSGTMLGQATYTGSASASGWQQVTFTSPVSIAANTTYVAAYFSTSGYAWTGSYFTSSGVDNAPLHALQSGVDGLNGVYAYGSSPTFPTAAYADSNWWADVVFAPAASGTPDLTITSSHTGNFTQGQTGATYTITVTNSGNAASSGTVTVSESVPSGLTATSISGGNWNCTQPAGPCTRSDALAAGASYPAITLTVNVASNAAASVTNTVTVSGGGETNSSNDQSTDLTAINASGGGGGTATSIWDNSATPNTLYQFSTATTTGVKFRSDVGGTISGIRFYKGASNTGTYIGLLYSSAGTLLAQASYTGSVSASGWQQVTFSSPVSIAANTTYVAAYFSTSGYAWTGNYFTSAGVDSAPLHGLRSGVDGLNGVYAYGNSPTFPTAGYADSNWWADVVFAPAGAGTPDLTVTSNHTGNFTQGQTSATYTITVTNSGSAATSGTVTVAETVPSGLTATSIAGSNWNCTQPAGPCTRSDALAAGASYPAITLAVNVAANAPASVTNTVTVSGGGETNAANDQATDSTTITPSGGGGGTATSIWDSSATPNTLYQFNTATTTGVKFRSDVAGTISGIRFYKGAANTGTYIGLLYTSSGTLLAQATYTGSTSASGWQQVTFTSPVSIAANTTYIAAYFSASGYAWTGSYFTSSGVDNAPLHALKSGVDGLNGVYAYGNSPTFPTAGYADSNWWADVVFTASGPAIPDLTVASNHTGNFTQGQTGATYTITVTNSGSAATSGTVTMTEAVPSGLTATSVSGSNWNCTQPAGPCTRSDALATGASYPTITLTVNVAANAPASVSNTVTVAGGGETNSANDQATDATTVGIAAQPVSIWNGTGTPATLYQLASSTTTGMKFRSDVAGTITGIRFYKGAQNTGTYIGLLYSSTGTLLAQATYTGSVSASGWQQVTFTTPVAIAANTTYVAAYFSTSGYAWTGSYFTAAGVDNAPLHALKSGVDGPNGVYAYGTSPTFPTSSYADSNWWVDVVFTSTGGS